MAYDNLIDASDAAALIPQEVSNEIIEEVSGSSAVLKLAKRLPNMTAAQKRMPVTSALATAYFVDGATGLKQTSEVNWTNKYIDAEELAVIIPVPETVLNDSQYDIWGNIKPQLVEAFGAAIDAAVLHGTNIPVTWTTNLGAAGLVAASTAKSHTKSAAAYVDLYEAILGESGAGVDGILMLIEADGYMATGHLAHVSMRGKLRNVRTTDGQPIFKPNMQEAGRYDLDGAPCVFPLNGSIDSSAALMISGDWSKLVYAIRQDVTYKVLDQAVIQDGTGAIVYNLAQQDMVALRAVMRLGVALPQTINRMNATPFPFAVLTA